MSKPPVNEPIQEVTGPPPEIPPKAPITKTPSNQHQLQHQMQHQQQQPNQRQPNTVNGNNDSNTKEELYHTRKGLFGLTKIFKFRNLFKLISKFCWNFNFV